LLLESLINFVVCFEIFVFVYTANIGQPEKMDGIKKEQMNAHFLEKPNLTVFM